MGNQRIEIIHTLKGKGSKFPGVYVIQCLLISCPNNAEFGFSPTLQVILANTGDPQASHLASKLSETGAKVMPDIAIQTK